MALSAMASVFSGLFFLPFGVIESQANPIEEVSVSAALALLYSVAVAVLGLVAWNKGVHLLGAIFILAGVYLTTGQRFTLKNQVQARA